MPEKRFFTPLSLEPQAAITLAGEEAHHLQHVMRCKVKDHVELINGKGFLADAEIIKTKKETVELFIHSVREEKADSFEIILAQGMPRPNRLDPILEKCTELGVSQIWLFPGMLSEKKELKPSQLKRMENIVIAATKQSGRLFLPTIEAKPPLAKWQPPREPSYFGDIDPKAPALYSAWTQEPPKNAVIFFVGPEQGFHSDELELFNTWGTKGVKLHHNILRTDTAPLCALSLISHFLFSKI